MPDHDWRFGTEGGTSPTVRITLDCGHTFRARTQPWSRRSRYACPAGQGCGYQRRWAAWTCGDAHSENPDVAPDPPPSPDPPEVAA
jgi:hypothetical protein